MSCNCLPLDISRKENQHCIIRNEKDKHLPKINLKYCCSFANIS